MSQSRIRVGVVGLGFGQQAVIPGYQACPDTEVLAVCSRDPAKAQAVATKYQVPHACVDYDAMLQLEELDVVHIATPPYLHRVMTLSALRAGKHVLCEKPMALSVAEAEEMHGAAEAARRLGMINHEYRFLPTWAYMKKRIDEGYLGRLHMVDLTAYTGGWADALRPPAWADPEQSPWSWLSQKEMGGGILGALGTHLIDGLQWWFGEIESVCGQLGTFVQERKYLPSGELRAVTADDSFAFLTRFANGAQGAVRVSFVVHGGSGMQLKAYGSEGTLALDNLLDPRGKLWGAGRGESTLAELSIPIRFQFETNYDDRRLGAFVRLIETMAEGIRTGQKVSPGFCDGLKVQRVIEAIDQSDSKGRWTQSRER